MMTEKASLFYRDETGKVHWPRREKQEFDNRMAELHNRQQSCVKPLAELAVDTGASVPVIPVETDLAASAPESIQE